MISSKRHLLEAYLCTPAAALREDSRTSSVSTQTSCADSQMRFLGDGEALCVPGNKMHLSKSMDSLMLQSGPQNEQTRHLYLKNRLLWEENRRLNEELKYLKAQCESTSKPAPDQSRSRRDSSEDHPVLNGLMRAQSKRQGSVTDAISMLAQASKSHVLTFGPHAIRHMAVQLLLWTFLLEEQDSTESSSQPIRLNFYRQGADPQLFSKAKEWVGEMNIKGEAFQKNAQRLVDDHLRSDQAVERPSEYNTAVLANMMMRYPEVKDSSLFSTHIVEKQTNPLNQLADCII